MTLYVDSSAWMKRYFDEPESDACVVAMSTASGICAGRHALVEVRRNIARLAPTDAEATRLGSDFDADWSSVAVLELDAPTCAIAADVAQETGCRTLDALHVACAWRAGGAALTMLTYDARMARAAQAFGIPVASPR